MEKRCSRNLAGLLCPLGKYERRQLDLDGVLDVTLRLSVSGLIGVQVRNLRQEIRLRRGNALLGLQEDSWFEQAARLQAA